MALLFKILALYFALSFLLLTVLGICIVFDLELPNWLSSNSKDLDDPQDPISQTLNRNPRP